MSLLKIAVAIAAGPAIIQSMMNMYPPFQAMVGRKAYNRNPDLIPTTEQMVTLRHRGEITPDEYTNTMRQAGFSDEVSEELFNASVNYLTVFDYITLWRRKELSEEDLEKQLTILGFTPEQQQRAKIVTLYYPNPQDIVRFAVREVYTPEAVNKFGLDEDLPPQYLDAASKGGLSDEFATQFWRAHWVLPSPNQVYEMLHRRIIDPDTVEMYMKQADFMPYWRQPLIDLSYNPLTRVDVRRMHAMGVLNRKQVKEAYLDLGYNDENAERMTVFTELYNKGREGEKVEIPILNQYKRGIIDRAEATNALTNLNLSVDDITEMLNNIDEERKWELIDVRADSVINEYRAGVIDEQLLKVRLTAIGVPNDRLETTIALEMAQAESRTRQPSKTDVEGWLIRGIIDVNEYRRLMGNLKYDSVSIERYLTEIAMAQGGEQEKQLTLAQFRKMFIEGLKTEQEYIEYLVSKGYGQDDIEDLVAQAKAKIK